MASRRALRPISALLVALSLLLGLSVLGAPHAGAMGTIDQQQSSSDGSLTLMPGLAQTFAVGRTGVLDGIDLLSPSGGRFLLQVYPLRADGTPDITQPLMAYNAQANLLAGVYTQVPLPGANVAAGQQLALAIGLQNPYYTTGSLATASGDAYAAGQLFSVPGVYTFNPLPGMDLEFATHVTAAPAVTSLALQPLSATAGKPTATVTSFGTPVAGRIVTFDLHQASGKVKASCSAVTDASGKAACSKRWSMPTGGWLSASFAGDAQYAASSATVNG